MNVRIANSCGDVGRVESQTASVPDHHKMFSWSLGRSKASQKEWERDGSGGELHFSRSVWGGRERYVDSQEDELFIETQAGPSDLTSRVLAATLRSFRCG
jgi:hypothetical protein